MDHASETRPGGGDQRGDRKDGRGAETHVPGTERGRERGGGAETVNRALSVPLHIH